MGALEGVDRECPGDGVSEPVQLTEPLLKPEDVARLLRVPRSTVYELGRRGLWVPIRPRPLRESNRVRTGPSAPLM